METGTFDGLSGLITLNLQNNPLHTIQLNAWGSAFAASSTTYTPFVSAETSAPGLVLTQTNLTSLALHEAAFLLLPDLVTIQLGFAYAPPSDTGATPPLILDTCCGIEWLANLRGVKYSVAANSILCRNVSSARPVSSISLFATSGNAPVPTASFVTNSSSSSSNARCGGGNASVHFNATELVPLGRLAGLIVCPCLPLMTVIPSTSSSSCQAVSTGSVLLDGQCRTNSPGYACPSGTTLVPIEAPGPSTVACMVDGQSAFAGYGIITESRCARCAVPGCTSCPGARTTCVTCADGTALTQENTCVSACPLGFAMISDPEQDTQVCLPCEQRNCELCTTGTPNSNVPLLDSCLQCSPPSVLLFSRCLSSCPSGFGPEVVPAALTKQDPGDTTTRLQCQLCAPDNCAVCSSNTTVCDQCVGKLLLYRNKCLASCPANTAESTLPGSPNARSGVVVCC